MKTEHDPQARAPSGEPAEIPRIYLACPLTNLDSEQQGYMYSLIANIITYVQRMTDGDRAEGDGWLVSTYAPINHTPPWDDDGLTPGEVYQRNLTEVLDSDALIAVAARAASAGVGQEIEWAAQAGMPILYLYDGENPSRQIAGIPGAITVQGYRGKPSLVEKYVIHFLRHRRLDICDGPRRRASKRLQFAPLTGQLRFAWARTADKTELAANCGLMIPVIESMLADSARVASMPVGALTALSTELGVAPFGAGRQLSVASLRALIAAADQFGWDDVQIETARAHGLELIGAEPEVPEQWRALLPPDCLP